ncbi:hypothetical protein LASUN_13220 [Lentilactobacillus sunkii]|jgi:hypothetical protein|uniref:Uncharacterized protein n=1 Tax=Lentilactobacillus sunkii TaxID=481719 RepID=A0A1E7XCT5_9LACO|nr:hypothetical protein [Lentilactobacillus sunkii]OFA10772.1 hypothetical protein LASUN_13220 [Lentilactobacillus sunkii]
MSGNGYGFKLSNGYYLNDNHITSASYTESDKPDWVMGQYGLSKWPSYQFESLQEAKSVGELFIGKVVTKDDDE